MKKKNKPIERCEPCQNCPICYKKALESGEDFKLIKWFIIIIIGLFIVQKLI